MDHKTESPAALAGVAQGPLDEERILQTSSASHGCPVHGAGASVDDRRTGAVRGVVDGPALEQDGTGTFRIRSYAAARQLLRGAETTQAGFSAEELSKLPGTMRLPILFQEGPAHHQQRKATARFFTPKTVSERYHTLMQDTTERAMATLQRDGRANVSQLAMSVAVDVATQIIGLTEHRRGGMLGMARRLEAFFGSQPNSTTSFLVKWGAMLRNYWSMSAFYWMDVQPSIRRRRKHPGDDVISHLIAQGYRDSNILIECITYAAAGMVTTREFITVATWRLLEDPALKTRYVAADAPTRRAILEEILRLEPVVGSLYRRATTDVTVEVEGQAHTIPAGARIELSIAAANTVEATVGACPLHFRHDRTLPDPRTPGEVLSFGDGAHRCPGAYVALQESDIFLHRLCTLPNVRLVRPPDIRWNSLVAGYELRECIIAVD